MKKTVSLLLFVFMIVCSLSDIAFASEHDLSAKSFVLLDADTGEVLLSRNQDEKMPMASTTKIMTAICVIENCDLEKEITVPNEAVGVEGSSMYLFKGERIKIGDLLFGLMLESANDASVALAIETSGSVEAFVRLMNEKAEKIGLISTHFANPNGLPNKEHYSTALEMSLLYSHAFENETFREIVGTKKYSLTLSNGKRQNMTNHNKLLFSDPCSTGGKTGFTKEAGRCLVTSSCRDGKNLVCTTLSAPNDWEDHKKLCDFGFSLFENRKILDKNEISLKIPVTGGEESELLAVNADEVFANVKKNGGKIEVRIEMPHFLYAPITGLDEGNFDSANTVEPIGKALVFQDERLIKECELFAKKSVMQQKKKTLWEKICDLIKSLFG